MKRTWFVLCILIFIFCSLAAPKNDSKSEPKFTGMDSLLDEDKILDDKKYNYGGGNGTIIEQFIKDNIKITRRKHIQTIMVHLHEGSEEFGIPAQGAIDAYEKPDKNSSKIFEVKTGDNINTLIFRSEEDIKSEREDYRNNWLRIKNTQGRVGWIKCVANPYKEGNWSILGILRNGKKKMTVRKLWGELTVEKTDVFDKPGINNYAVLFQTGLSSESRFENVFVKAIVEEKDTFNGSTEHWVKIQDKQKRIGWIFGAYGHVYRGGNKYETPEEELDFYYYSCKNEQEQNPAGLFLFFSFAALPLFMPRRT